MIEEKEEIWKTIPEFPNYQVSNMGRVKSLGNDKKRNEKILKPGKNKSGYLKVNLCKEGKMKTMKIHRLVGQAFVQNDSLFNTEINHIDEDKTNNCAWNLQWCEHSYNMNYGTRNERSKKSLTNNKKLSKSVICVETGIIYPSVMEIERLFSFNNSNICECCNGKRKSAYKLHWQYVD